jgi:hypothetical protein
MNNQFKTSSDYKNNLEKIMEQVKIIRFIDCLEYSLDFLEDENQILEYEFLKIYKKVFNIKDEMFIYEYDTEYMNIIFDVLVEYGIFLGHKNPYHISVNAEMVHSLFEDLRSLGLIKIARKHDTKYNFMNKSSIERFIFNLEHDKWCDKVNELKNSNNEYKYYEEDYKLGVFDKEYFTYIFEHIESYENKLSGGKNCRIAIFKEMKKYLIDKKDLLN